MRALAVAYARDRIASGAGAEIISRELGLGRYTLRRWLSADDTPVMFRTVEIDEDAERSSTAGLVVHGPCGLRIEVHDVAALASLLRSLS